MSVLKPVQYIFYPSKRKLKIGKRPALFWIYAVNINY